MSKDEPEKERKPITITVKTDPKYRPARIIPFVAAWVVVIGVGVAVESEAMEWAGFMFLCISFGLSFIVSAAGRRGITIAEARARLDEIERNEVGQ